MTTSLYSNNSTETFYSSYSNFNNITETHFSNFLNKKNLKYRTTSKCLDYLIYAPTQVGKTQFMFDRIKQCLDNKTLIIISSNNNISIQNQTYSRFMKFNKTENLKANMTKIDKSYEKNIKYYLQKDNLVLFTLDNACQVKKMAVNLEKMLIELKRDNKTKFENIIIFFDEADLFIKNNPNDIINEQFAKSQKEWTEYIKNIENFSYPLNIKRVFITATPALCQKYFNINTSDVFSLNIPSNYIGYNNITFEEVCKKPLISIFKESNNIKKKNLKNTMILYSKERYVNKIKDKNSHLDILMNFGKKLPKFFICTLNSKGIYFKLPNNKFKSDWILSYKKASEHEEFKNFNVFWNNDNHGYVKSTNISNFYLVLSYLNSDYNLTIGKDLLNRGISFVSTETKKHSLPIVAHSIIIIPSASSHITQNVQAIGRITGKARPTLQRRLYCPEKYWTDYYNFHKIQEEFMMKCEQDQFTTTSYIIDNEEFNMKLKGKIDRLPVKYKSVKTIDDDYEINTRNTIDGVKLNRLKLWCKRTDLIVSKIIHYMYNNIHKNIKKDELIKILNITEHNIDSMSGLRCMHGKIINNGNIITLNKNIIPYITDFINN